MTFAKLYSLITEDLNSRLPFLLKKYKNQTEDSINQLALADPTPNKKYIDWLLKNSESFRIPEDINKLKSSLENFINLSKTSKWSGSKDINTYKSYKELIHAIESNTNIINTPPPKQINSNNNNDEIDNKIKVKEIDGWVLYKVTDAETIKELAQGTEWCVREEPYASDYLKKGPYYVIIDETNKEVTPPKDMEEDDWIRNNEDDYTYIYQDTQTGKYHIQRKTPIVLIHFPTAQIKDKYDAPPDAQTAEEVYPLIQNSFKYAKFNFNEGINDFFVFLKPRHHKIIAQGEDKEILEKYYEPEKAYNTLSKIANNSLIPANELKQLKQSIAKSPKQLCSYLTRINSLYTHSRDLPMEQLLLQSNNKKYIQSFANHLINAANYGLSDNVTKKLVSLIGYYTMSPQIQSRLNKIFSPYGLSFDTILSHAPSLPTLKDVFNYTKSTAQQYKSPILNHYDEFINSKE